MGLSDLKWLETNFCLICFVMTPSIMCLELTSNVSSPCRHDHVLFTCSTSRRYLRWTVTFTDPDRTVFHIGIEDYYPVGSEYYRQSSSVSVLVTVISTHITTEALSSTLIINTSRNRLLLNNTQIKCEDPQGVKITYYKIPGAPPQPSNFTLNNITYGNHSANVSISWLIESEGIDSFHNMVLSDDENLTSVVNVTHNVANLVAVPYDTNITIVIAPVVCDMQGQSGIFHFVVDAESACPDLTYLNISINKTSTGLEIVYHCMEGFVPKDVVESTCTIEEGLWSPDPSQHQCTVDFNGLGIIYATLTDTTVIGTTAKELVRSNLKYIIGFSSGAIAVMMVLIMILMLATIYIMILKRKQKMNRELIQSHTYDTIHERTLPDTMYETVKPLTGIEMSNNEAYLSFKLKEFKLEKY